MLDENAEVDTHDGTDDVLFVTRAHARKKTRHGDERAATAPFCCDDGARRRRKSLYEAVFWFFEMTIRLPIFLLLCFFLGSHIYILS